VLQPPIILAARSVTTMDGETQQWLFSWSNAQQWHFVCTQNLGGNTASFKLQWKTFTPQLLGIGN